MHFLINFSRLLDSTTTGYSWLHLTVSLDDGKFCDYLLKQRENDSRGMSTAPLDQGERIECVNMIQ